MTYRPGELDVSYDARLTRDPELRVTRTGTEATTLSLACGPRRRTDSGWEDSGPTIWTRVELYGSLAQWACDRLVRGDLVRVVGSLRREEWQSTDGTQRESWTVRAVGVQLINQYRAAEQQQPQETRTQTPAAQPQPQRTPTWQPPQPTPTQPPGWDQLPATW